MKVALIAPQMWVYESYCRSSDHLFRESGENTGNFAFVHALWSHLSPHVEIFPWGASPEAIRERCDIIVMACANQLGWHSDLEELAITFERAKLPVLAIGLGAQAQKFGATIELTAGTRRWLDVVAAHAPARRPTSGYAENSRANRWNATASAIARWLRDAHRTSSTPTRRGRTGSTSGIGAAVLNASPCLRACTIGWNSQSSSGFLPTSLSKPPGSISRSPRSI